jgi:hypothetical protein
VLDRLFSAYAQLSDPLFDDKYSADQAIIKATLLTKPGSKRLTVVFPPWHLPDWYSNRLISKLSSAKSSVLIYDFNQDILEDDILGVKSSFEFIALSVTEDVRALVKLYDFSEINLLGISLGGVALCITAEKLDNFNKVILVAPGNDLANAFWYGLRTRRLRNILADHGHQLKELQNEWSELAPENHVECLSDHPVRIILARKDKFIPYSNGKKLLDKLSSLDPNVSYITRPFGHLLTVFLYLIGPEVDN